MSGLVLKLGPRERVMINGVVMENGDRRTKIHVMTPGTVWVDDVRLEPGVVERSGESRRSIVEFAGQGSTPPCAEAGGRETDDPQDAVKSQDVPRAIDGSKKSRLVAGMRNAEALEVGLEQAKQREEDA